MANDALCRLSQHARRSGTQILQSGIRRLISHAVQPAGSSLAGVRAYPSDLAGGRFAVGKFIHRDGWRWVRLLAFTSKRNRCLEMSADAGEAALFRVEG